MTVDDMETLLAMSQRKKQNVDVRAMSNVEQDRIGKIGPWNLWMPTTRENSCEIAGYDPETMKPSTTWCTARTSGSNLFYNYATQPDVILFYLINDDAQNANDRLSVGFVNSKPYLKGEDGGLSVNGNNDGLTEKSLRQILGSSYEPNMIKLSTAAKNLKGQHPAAKKIDEAAQSLQAFQSMLKGLSQEEARDLKKQIAQNKNLSDEVALQLAQDENSSVRMVVSRNFNTKANVLAHLAHDEEPDIKRQVAQHRYTPQNVLTQLAQDEDFYVRGGVATNSKASSELLTLLALDDVYYVRARVAENANIALDVLSQLTKDQNVSVRECVAMNPKTPAEILEFYHKTNILTLENALQDIKTHQCLYCSCFCKIHNLLLEIVQKKN